MSYVKGKFSYCVLSIRMSSREIRHPFKRKYVATQSQPKISQAGSLTRKAAINSETILAVARLTLEPVRPRYTAVYFTD